MTEKTKYTGRSWIVCYIINTYNPDEANPLTFEEESDEYRYEVFDIEPLARGFYEGLKDNPKVHSASLTAVIESTDYETHPKFIENEN